jgi:ribonucleotide reductase beta subunit family protein with ferritin-like domain
MQEFIVKKIKVINRQITIDLPEEFKAEEVNIIVTFSKEEKKYSDSELAKWRKELIKEYSHFNVDLSNYKFNRDELYDRP